MARHIWAAVTSLLSVIGAETGQVLVLAALSLPVVLGFTGLAVDVGLMMHTRTEIQKDVDAMALAGALSLCGSSSCESEADLNARQWGMKNSVMESDNVVVQFGSDCNGNTSANHDLITVRVTRYRSTFFARVVGFNGSNIPACATARKYDVAGLGNGLRPWGIEDSCMTDMEYGSPVILKYGAEGNGGPCGPSSGNFGALAIDGNGAKTYRQAIEHGSTSPVCADSVPNCTSFTFPTETGNIVGPTGQGIDYLSLNTPSSCRTWAQVSDGNGGITRECNPWLPGYEGLESQIVVVPIVHGLWSNGKNDVTVKRLAIVFVTGYEGCSTNGQGSCQVRGYFMNSTVTIRGAQRAPLSEDSSIAGVALIN